MAEISSELIALLRRTLAALDAELSGVPSATTAGPVDAEASAGTCPICGDPLSPKKDRRGLCDADYQYFLPIINARPDVEKKMIDKGLLLPLDSAGRKSSKEAARKKALAVLSLTTADVDAARVEALSNKAASKKKK